MNPCLCVHRWLPLVLCCVACFAAEQLVLGEEPEPGPSLHEIRSLLDSIDPYLPRTEVTGEVDVFGSTTMDALAHGWAAGFTKFHPQAKIVVTAEGSEGVFERLSKNPGSVGMMSRPVSANELNQSGLKRPVALIVSRDAIGVFVNEKNPLETITYAQIVTLFCGDDASKEITWNAVGVTGPLADQPVHLIGRNKSSGSQKFVEQYLLRSHKLRPATASFSSNAKVVEAIEKDPAAIAICGLKCGSHNARALHLREGDQTVSDDDHAILVGRYPLTRPLTLVIDAGVNDEKARASREFLRYALSQAGQMQAILAGFFPLDPPSLRGQLLKLDESLQNQGTDTKEERLSVTENPAQKPRNNR